MAQADLVGALETENRELEKQNRHLMKLLTEARAEIDGLRTHQS
jgi:hypothetical protein